jgi:F0F1-type ATP synthase assembly protein I
MLGYDISDEYIEGLKADLARKQEEKERRREKNRKKERNTKTKTFTLLQDLHPAVRRTAAHGNLWRIPRILLWMI